MQTIELTHPYKEECIVQEPIVLALGFFDGIHLGHQEVITTAKKVAQELGFKVAVMSFNQHREGGKKGFGGGRPAGPPPMGGGF